MRVMLLHSTADAPIDYDRSFVVEESVSASDLPETLPPTGRAATADVVFEVPPHPEYSQAAMRDGAQGTIQFICRSHAQNLRCRTADIKTFQYVSFPSGELEPAVRSYFLLLHDAQNAMQGTKIAPLTKDGRSTEGLDIVTSLRFNLN
jgi:hypothetical protein